MYGKRKAIAKRKPLLPSSTGSGSKAGSLTTRAYASTTTPATAIRLAYQSHEEQDKDHEPRDMLSTPAVTEGETTESETTETEMDDNIQTQTHPQVMMINHNDILPGRHSIQKKMQTTSVPKLHAKSRHQSQLSISSTTSVSSDSGVDNGTTKKRGLSQHDLLNKYFRRDAVVLRNVDLLRYGY